MSSPTVGALPTGDVVRQHHTVPRLKMGGVCGLDLPGEFVTKDEGRARDSVPFHDVAPADPTGADAEQDLPGPDGGNGALLDTDVLVVVVDRHAHGAVIRQGGFRVPLGPTGPSPRFPSRGPERIRGPVPASGARRGPGRALLPSSAVATRGRGSGGRPRRRGSGGSTRGRRPGCPPVRRSP